jgi:hypothetical protein
VDLKEKFEQYEAKEPINFVVQQFYSIYVVISAAPAAGTNSSVQCRFTRVL